MKIWQFFENQFKQGDYQYSPRVEVFFKGWYLIFFLKILLLGPMFQELENFQLAGGKSLFFGPANLIKWITLITLLIGLVTKRNFWLSTLIFSVVLITHRIIHPITNGGDTVILFFMFISIFCNQRPSFKAGTLLEAVQLNLIRFSLLFGRVQIALIYLSSGWDKLTTPAWRDGSVLNKLLQLELYGTGWLQSLMAGFTATHFIILSGLVIIFQMLFPVLIWFGITRYYMLTFGVLFHLVIGFGLSLPDFATVMIWSYVLWLSDKDFDSLATRLLSLKNNNLINAKAYFLN